MGKRFISAGMLVLVGLVASAAADQIALEPAKDNVLYENYSGALSNGAGVHLFVGRTSGTEGGMWLSARRAVVAFDVAGSIPSSSTINSVTLKLNMSRTSSGAQTVSLHRLLADWGEGASDAPGEEGGGASSTTNDATWIHSFFNTTSWTNAGGDFSATVSASTSVDAVGSYAWGSTAQIVADVQGWLDDPSGDFGWILTGPEGSGSTTKRFDSREYATASNRPLLTIDYTAPVPEPGTILLTSIGILISVGAGRKRRAR